jgi:hypothetical protein
LVHWNGWQRSFQASMKIRIAWTRSATLVKVPRRIALRVMIPKKISTRFIQLAEVGVKCRWILGLRASQARTLGCLWVP